MAKYRATIETERGNSVSRQGRRELKTHTRGWNHGVKVVCDINGIRAWETGGSNNPNNDKLIYSKKIT